MWTPVRKIKTLRGTVTVMERPYTKEERSKQICPLLIHKKPEFLRAVRKIAINCLSQ